MAETLLRIENDGPRITTTNFWQLDLARQGKFFLSLNAGAFRLLVPQQHLRAVREMRSTHTGSVLLARKILMHLSCKKWLENLLAFHATSARLEAPGGDDEG